MDYGFIMDEAHISLQMHMDFVEMVHDWYGSNYPTLNSHVLHMDNMMPKTIQEFGHFSTNNERQRTSLCAGGVMTGMRNHIIPQFQTEYSTRKAGFPMNIRDGCTGSNHDFIHQMAQNSQQKEIFKVISHQQTDIWEYSDGLAFGSDVMGMAAQTAPSFSSQRYVELETFTQYSDYDN